MIAQMAAVRSSDVAFIVLMAGPGIPGDKLLLMQNGLISVAECNQLAKESMTQTEKWFAIARDEKDPKVAKQKIAAELAKLDQAARKKLEAQLSSAANQLNGLLTPRTRARYQWRDRYSGSSKRRSRSHRTGFEGRRQQ
jgi:hypothetical protein